MPAQILQGEGGQILIGLGTDLHPAAQHLDDVGDDFVLENLGVVRLQTVENLAPHRDHRLEFRLPGQLYGA